MGNNSDLPEGWTMPDDLAKKISEVLNNKPISPEDELADALGDMSRDIALIEPNPQDWGWWVTYLLEQVERQPGLHRQSTADRSLRTGRRDALLH